MLASPCFLKQGAYKLTNLKKYVIILKKTFLKILCVRILDKEIFLCYNYKKNFFYFEDDGRKSKPDIVN